MVDLREEVIEGLPKPLPLPSNGGMANGDPLLLLVDVDNGVDPYIPLPFAYISPWFQLVGSWLLYEEDWGRPVFAAIPMPMPICDWT
jgi:hypothetical protein